MSEDDPSVDAGFSISISINHSGNLKALEASAMAQSASPNAVQQLGGASVSENVSSSVNQASSSNPKQSRKRTKTGCLTCRKRRIKCGEERPTCNNCIKSKRNCEGYTQRVIFKQPSYRQGGGPDLGQPTHYQPVPMQDGYPPQYALPPTPSPSQAPLLPIAPRPLYQEGVPDSMVVSSHYGSNGQELSGGGSYLTSGPYADNDIDRPLQGYYVQPEVRPALGPPEGPIPHDDLQRISHTSRRPASMYANPVGLPDLQPTSEAGMPQKLQESNLESTLSPGDMSEQPDFMKRRSLGDHFPSRSDDDLRNVALHKVPATSGHDAMKDVKFVPPMYKRTSTSESLNPNYPFIPGPQVKVEPLNAIHTWQGSGAGRRFSVEGFVQQTSFDTKIPTRPIHPIAPAPLVDSSNDDFFEDESMMDDDVVDPAPPAESNLGLMLALSASQDDRHVRSYTSFLNEPNVLATYHPSATASPLMDPQTARIFCHFVTSTGPSVSIYERHPTNPSLMFNGFPVPAAQQAMWTYTLPTMALANQALLHSMLALASLHISKLQQTSPTPSLKHYHYALRRVAKAVGLPQRRSEIGTLAATLLLGFYEVMTAEHSKWSSHLLGAKQLMVEIDYVGMTKRVRNFREGMKAKKREYQMGYGRPELNFGGIEDLLPDKEFEVDANLVSAISGYSVSYDYHGTVIEGGILDSMNPLTIKDLETYKIQSDLFWWYCKQDVFQAMVSGNRLLMPYDRWVHCPPRAAFGRLDSIYATMDHAILLLGRIADFAGKDQKRKKRLADLNGGHWKPPANFAPGGMERPPPSTHSSRSSTVTSGATTKAPSSTKGPPIPSMHGMIPPPPRPARMPEAFAPSGRAPQDISPVEGPGSFSNNVAELETQTIEAEKEWQDIENATGVFERSLPSEFHPLGPNYVQPIPTPFGPALQYRTLTISCIWVFFLTGVILHQRTHPSMPPAAMMAAGVAAMKTADAANRIGRVCAGIYPQDRSITSMNPTLGAALIESTMGLFFAGVQFMDPAQRGWTITKLRDIARLTGWQSSAAIAAGCEIAWEQAGLAGRGPPYQRTMDPMAKDERVAGRKPENLEAVPNDHNDRRFIVGNLGTRVHWALGILSLEEDVQKLDLGR